MWPEGERLSNNAWSSIIYTDEVPNIAVLGSGGGLRAMVGLLGSLSQLKEEGLLDCIMYLCGVSGSTWCMASLYKEPDWSAKLETVKYNIVQRLAEGRVNWRDVVDILVKYSSEKDNFSVTDVWAALIVSNIVKEIDQHRLTEQRGKDTKDPYPIYTVIDKQCKHDKLNADVWFEITPDESGYSLSGVFVDSSCLGSQFENGKKIKDQPEMDMLYLQEMQKNIQGNPRSQAGDAQKGRQALLKLVELNLCALREEDPTVHLTSINELLKGRSVIPENLVTSKGTIFKTELKDFTLSVCTSFFDMFGGRNSWDDVWIAIVRSIEKILAWVWGTTYNFLYGMTAKDVDPSVLRSKIREYEDAAALLNAPFFSVLRKERDVDLIISLDFSEGDPFETVEKAAAMCKDQNIPFPKVDVPRGEKTKPKDFYVFKDETKAPTVIHIPLFNDVNCKGEIEKWKKRYPTVKTNHSRTDITDLLEKAGLNIKNNKEKLLDIISKTKSSTNLE